MTAILIKFWPALIPLAIFLLWYVFMYPKAKVKKGYVSPLEHKIWIWTLGGTLVIALLVVIVMLVEASDNSDKTFVPTQYKDGKVIESHFEAQPSESTPAEVKP